MIELEHIVRRDKSSFPSYEESQKKVQSSVSEYDELPGWKNAMLWWEKDGDKPPVRPRPFRGDKRYRRRLYKVDMGRQILSLIVGDSSL